MNKYSIKALTKISAFYLFINPHQQLFATSFSIIHTKLNKNFSIVFKFQSCYKGDLQPQHSLVNKELHLSKFLAYRVNLLTPSTPNTSLDDDLGFDSLGFNNYLRYLGVGLIGVSILYLIAANWFWFDKPVKLAIPMLFLLITALMSSLGNFSHAMRGAIECLSGLAVGLCLAVIGQVYQTGADSFWLFTLWSLLLVPWLYRHNVAVFGLLVVVSNLAVGLFCKQVLDGEFAWYLLLATLLNALYLWAVMYHYAFWRYAMIFIIGALACAAAVAVGNDELSVWHLCYLLTWFVLPSVAWRYYYKKDAIVTALLAVSVGISLMCYLFALLSFWFVELWFNVGTWLLLALASFGLFLYIGKLIYKFFPKKQLHRLPMAFGAWLASLFLIASVLALMGFDYDVMMVIGSVLWGVGFLIFVNHARTDFVRQLGYCLLLAGHGLLLFVAYILGGDYGFSRVDVALVVQLVLLGLLLSIRQKIHWLILAGQGVVLYGLIMIAGGYWLSHLTQNAQEYGKYMAVVWADGLIVAIFTLGLLRYHRARLMLSLSVAVFAFCIRHTFINGDVSSIYGGVLTYDDVPNTFVLFGMIYAVQLIWVMVIVNWASVFQVNRWQSNQNPTLLNNKPALKPIFKFRYEQCIFAVLGVVCTLLGCWHLFVLLVGLLVACHAKDKLYQGLYAIAMVVLLGLIYYDLSLGLVFKALTMAGTGAAFVAVAVLLQKLNIDNKVIDDEKPL